MTGKTHILGGLIAGELFAVKLGCPFGSPLAAVILGSSVFGALLPDIDHAGSTISNANGTIKTVSKAAHLFFGHRGFLHTPLFVFLIMFISNYNQYFGVENGWYIINSLSIGMLSHLILDSLNPSGVMWLYPIASTKIHIAAIRTGSAGEKCISILLSIALFTVTVKGILHI